MSFTHIDSASDDTVGTSIEIPKPSGTVENDIMFAVIDRYWYTTAATSTPSGWNKVDDQTSISGYFAYSVLYWKLAGASEPASYTWGFSGYHYLYGGICTWRGGFDTTDPIDDYSNTKYVTNNTTVRGASVTVSADNSPVIIIGGTISTLRTYSPPAGYDEDMDTVGVFAASDVVSSGATGSLDATISSSVAEKHAYVVALNPAPPIISDCDDEDLADSDTGVTLDGSDLTGATLELGDAATYGACAVKSTQTINSNDGSEIDFSVVKGSLDYGTNYLYATVSGVTSAAYAVNLYDPHTIASLSVSSGGTGDSVTITGGPWGAVQGTSKVYLADASDRSGSETEQTVSAWADTEITVTIAKGSLSFGSNFFVVARNSAALGD